MVARINISKSITKVLNYNEQKLKTGRAELIHALGFIKRADKLSFYDKLKQFERYICLNERSVTNALHVSLNFDLKDELSKEKLVSIADAYMLAIGFSHQPYLVYQHLDAGHPHIHIVSTNIQKDGSRISVHNLGRNQSEKGRKQIEIDFGLVRAEGGKTKEGLTIQKLDAQKIRYGTQSTKQAMSNVLKEVIEQYKYGSLPELNAVLKLYNLTADRGKEESKMFKGGGLLFKVTNESGISIGAPVKASAFHMKPTLSNLERRFSENKAFKKPHSTRLITAVEFALAKSKTRTLAHFISELEKDRISTVLRQNDSQLFYGITFIDHRTKCVFNGSDLGREYSIRNILGRLPSDPSQELSLISTSNQRQQKYLKEDLLTGTQAGMLDLLVRDEQQNASIPFPYRKDPKKKKRKRFHL